MRIIAGQWRGRPLIAPQGQATRPTADRTREALFSMLASRLGSFEGLAVADVCAGTGALGLEALSRGAARCTFVERDRAAVEALRANIAKLGAAAEVRAIAAESFAGGAYDLVLIDPPYGTGLGQKILPAIGLAPGGWASIETARDEAVAVPGFTVEAERVHGKARITLLRSAP
ncbi:16S rRNA (guanine(966)-N(2))-methyltransferase RsmD [Sphingomonas histidinilytica]|jgi:16S rRNA (guanine966-N2)-methyltransferase|uniref:16S rRNA (guanine(966)-N(2))-methyltransferase RsmD n=1 Tax=Rhizorhabdus histidinilytica TaxID=439228 RepID=UPI000F774D5D|nr:16S rRNA (guanine(966)-N(2))-methyltransferase RsmD [Rhizorhabdus histidinilytica]MBO9379041.1 16S rRNA (guanine(966)-N(2))-methyltransferase RsmD [Rhizorhabdus histidinilytica]QEH80318.1 16S rRNA (guanine(966)-N(2))-methyltransferase RsmD [Sphingomonas sp. C8-2]